MASDSTYPKRPKVFALQFLREMVNAGVPCTLGADVFTLLVVLATQEDAIRYARAPDFFNGQLAERCGFGSEDKLVRVRARAVEARWLHYEPGRKRNPGRYWVLIPHGRGDNDRDREAEAELSPAPVRVQPDSFHRTGAETNAFPRAFPPQSRGGKCGPTVPVSSSPPSEGGTATAATAAAGATKEPARGKTSQPAGPHHESLRAFGAAWRVRYGAPYPFDYGKDGAMVKWMLEQVGGDPAKLAAVFDRYLADDDAFAVKLRHGLDLLRRQFNRWLVESPAPKTARVMTPRELETSGLR